MNLPLFIAGRYLFSGKSHNVINVISLISAAGMAVGTAALILVLSVFNGFGAIVDDNLSDIDPDMLIVPRTGKTFVPSAGLMKALDSEPGISSVCETVRENVFILYDGRQGVAEARGVDSSYMRVARLDRHLVEGSLELMFGELAQCCIGAGLSYELGAHPQFSDRMELFFPDRNAAISVADPAASLRSIEVFPSGVVSVDNETDRKMLLLPIDRLRSLLDYDREVSSLELRLAPGADFKRIERMLPPGLLALDKMAQHPELYRMMRYEKTAIFLILLFVVVIIAFNIFGSLSMLIIEKRQDIETLKSMGASGRTVRRIFVLEGWLVSLCGLAAGIVLGVGIALLQQKTGFVRMPGNYLVDAYPVVLKAADVALTAAAVALTGFLISLAALKGALRKE
ncbi:MAG: FtsX-like permease family protein [Bacteroidales bacterium]|nr:FtsX-like permease family protein [Bacteroidales bacterium]